VASGTGFFISNDGYLLTNRHVVNDCKSVGAIALQGLYEVTVVETSATLDLALLKFSGWSGPFGDFASKMPEQGDEVYAIGFPLLEDFRAIKITDGIVSGLSGSEGNSSEMQVTAAIQPGNSGGPLVDDSGHVIGVVAAKYTGQVQKGVYAEGISFAVAHEAVIGFLQVNGIKPVRAKTKPNVKPRDIIKDAKQWTVPLICLADKA
jgi:S1-C subfamily serine protease